VQIVIFVDLTV